MKIILEEVNRLCFAIFFLWKNSNYIRLTFWHSPHENYDHIGNAFYLIDNIKINKIIFNNNDFNELETSLIEKLKKKRIAYSKEMDSTFEMIYGTWHFLATINYDNENDNSLVTY